VNKVDAGRHLLMPICLWRDAYCRSAVMLTATILVLALWLAFVWIVDPDGFGETARRKHRRDNNSSRFGSGAMTRGSNRDV
jgi:hypothetical protein